MKVLIVTTVPPPISGIDVHGIYKRLGMFIHSFSQVSSSLRILYLPVRATNATNVQESAPSSQTRDLAEWGVPGVGTVIYGEPSRLNIFDLLKLLFSITSRPKFKPYHGVTQRAFFESELEQKPDLIFFHRLASTVVSRQWQTLPAPVIFDLDDIEHRVKFRSSKQAHSLPKVLWRLAQIPALYMAERAAIRSATCTFVCSTADREYLHRNGIIGRIEVVPNAVAFPLEINASANCRTVMFMGGYDYEPNSGAAQRLITRIWPQILRRIPDARLLIAGKSPEQIPAFNQEQENVEFLGFVNDLDELYQSTSLICCPIEIGGGTRVKLIEAAAYGKPIVSSRIGAEGLAFTEGVEIEIGESDDELAQACIILLENSEIAGAMGLAARKKASELYELYSIEAQLRSIAKEVFAHGLINHHQSINYLK